MERAILFSGLVRKPDQFQAFLAALESIDGNERPAVIFSTWLGELTNYPEIRAQLARMDAIVVEQKQPNIILTGHMLHQVVSLDAALSLLGDDVFVLRARPDFYIDWTLRAFLQKLPERTPATANERFSLSHRVLVTGVQPANPFYIDDITFAGLAKDLRKLVRLPFVFGTRYSRLAPEQWLWAAPFLSEYAALDAFFRVNVGLIFGDDARSAKLRDVLMESSLYARAVLLGLIIFRENFDFFSDHERDKLRVRAQNFALEALLWEDIQLPNMAHHPNAHVNVYRSYGPIEAITACEYSQSEFGDRVKAILPQTLNGDLVRATSAERTGHHEEASKLGQRIENTVGIPGMKHFRDGSRNRSITGADPQWTFGQLGTDLTSELERDNSNLRRTIDQLNARIREAEKGKSPWSKF